MGLAEATRITRSSSRPGTASTAPVHAASIAVGSGPESLAIYIPVSAPDAGKHAYAFTHATTAVVQIDVVARSCVKPRRCAALRCAALRQDAALGRDRDDFVQLQRV